MNKVFDLLPGEKRRFFHLITISGDRLTDTVILSPVYMRQLIVYTINDIFYETKIMLQGDNKNGKNENRNNRRKRYGRSKSSK